MIGLDIVDVSRISKVYDSQNVDRIFTSAEIEYANRKSKVKVKGQQYPERDNSFAGMFAAKEAFLKALGFGLGDFFSLNEIEVSHYASGKPYIILSDKIKSLLKEKKFTEVNLSISHDAGVASAIVEIH